MTDPSMIEIKESNNAEISISKLVVPFDNHDYGSSSSINFFSKELNISDFVLKNPTPSQQPYQPFKPESCDMFNFGESKRVNKKSTGTTSRGCNRMAFPV